MHAVVATVRIEDVKAAREALADLRVGLVPRAPGFVSAYWLAPVDGIGMSVIVFDTKENAEEALRYPVPPLPGVTPLTAEIREVYASA
jgi:hypothetical protein